MKREQIDSIVDSFLKNDWVNPSFTENLSLNELYNEIDYCEDSSGCLCYDCRVDRCYSTQNLYDFLVVKIYPNLPEVPGGVSPNSSFNYIPNNNVRDNRFHFLSSLGGRKLFQNIALYIYNLRFTNKEIRPTLDKTKNIFYCRFCGELHTSTVQYLFKSICPTCQEHFLGSCDSCGISSAKLDMVSGKYCKKCAAKLVSCGNCLQFFNKQKILRFKTARNVDGTFSYFNTCSDCLDKNKVSCSECGDIVPYSIVNQYGSLVLCPSCCEEKRGFHKNYNYKPIKIRFKKSEVDKNIDKDTGLFFGVELELDTVQCFHRDRNTISQLMIRELGESQFYVMHDGSFGDRNGIEIVSYPFSNKYYKDYGIEFWNNLLLYCRGEQLRDEDGYGNAVGMHIHTTKAAWSSLQIYKLIKFMYNKDHLSFFIKIAQREPNQYCRLHPEDFIGAAFVAKTKQNSNRDHYGYINLNNKSRDYSGGKTIEFRMFKSTLEPLYFHKNMEFVKSCFDFTKNVSKNKMKLDYYFSFIEEHKYKYPALIEFLKLKQTKRKIKAKKAKLNSLYAQSDVSRDIDMRVPVDWDHLDETASFEVPTLNSRR